MTEKVSPYWIENVYTGISWRNSFMLDGDPPLPYEIKPGPPMRSGIIIKFPKKVKVRE